MNPNDTLVCPHCHSKNLSFSTIEVGCAQCHRTYPVCMGIIDFRDAELEATADFSILEDRRIAEIMALLFPKTKTFNEMLSILDILTQNITHWSDFSKLDLTNFLVENNIRPEALRPDQSLHGYHILNQIDLYLIDAKRIMPPNGLALEDGCGLGFFVEGLAARFENLIVLDFSLCYLILVKKLIEEKCIENTTLICGNAESLPLGDAVFDFIHSNNVIEHVSNQEALVAEAKRTMKVGGLLFVRSPNRFSIYFEPHFRLPGYGFFPDCLRRKIIEIRQNRSVDAISLLSLKELRSLLFTYFGSAVFISFIPRNTTSTASGGKIRTFLVTLLRSRFGVIANMLINTYMLGVMPYHTAICFNDNGIRESHDRSNLSSQE
ncbi:MAG: class I SAM-dependent methyltransferase [Methylocystis sp.]|nr:class I SAM-dependent methyltransferase [Methylocystis sp.]